jgi:hypothetical protein
LQGLPAGHRCPECGFQLERDRTVFAGRRSGRFGMAVRVVVSLWVGLGFIGVAREPDTVGVVIQCAMAALVIAWWLTWFRRRKPYFVILADDELIYREAGAEKLRVKLDRVWTAEYSSLAKEVVLLDRNGQRVAAIPDLGGRDYKLVAGLCSAINRRAAAEGRT